MLFSGKGHVGDLGQRWRLWQRAPGELLLVSERWGQAGARVGCPSHFCCPWKQSRYALNQHQTSRVISGVSILHHRGDRPDQKSFSTGTLRHRV